VSKWVYIGALALALLGAGAGIGYGLGSASATATAAAKAAKLAKEVAADKLAQSQALNAANEHNRQLEKQHDQDIADLRADFAKQQAAAEAADAAELASLRSGNRRLRVQVTAYRAALAAGPGASAPGADEAGTAELAPAVGASLYAIAADGDTAIRQLTGLQAWARSAVKLCGAQPHEPQDAHPR